MNPHELKNINDENRAKELANEVIKEVVKKMIDNKVVKELAKEVSEEALFNMVNKGKDRRFRNTKLLMKNYKNLKQHTLSEKDEIKILYADMDEDYIKVDYMWLESIIKSKGKTIQMLKYIDEQLDYLKKKYKENKQYEKYRVFELLTIEGKSIIEIQGETGCGKNSPSTWSNEIIKELSVLLWGVDALSIL